MSRLIDADKFKEYIVDGFEQNKDLFTDEQRDFVKVITCGFLKDIDEQPTVYDIDKIVEQSKTDGCNGCKYISKDEYEEPCLRCKRNCKDYWRAGVEND